MNSSLQTLAWRVAITAVAVAVMALPAAAADHGPQLKDLHIQQMPMTELTPPPPNAGVSESGLAVSATVDRPDRNYQDGDRLVLTVETSEDAYVWVFDTGTSGKVHQIFPNRYESANFVAANSPIAIPAMGSNYELAVSHPRGAELITVVASKNNTPLAPDELIDTSGGGTFLALRGDAASVAKDLAITLREQHSTWVKDEVVVRIE